MSSAAENRRRVALASCAPSGANRPTPGLDGMEVRYLRALLGPIAPQGDQGHTEFAGGWATAKLQIGKGAR